MADVDAQKIIELVFRGVDQTSAAISGVLNSTDKFASGVQSATQPIADFTVGALKMEAGLLAAGTAVTAFSVKLASDFQSAALDLQKVLGDTDPPLEQFTERARELSREYGVAGTEVLQSMANFKQAGFTAQEAGELTKNGLDLVIAGGINAATGADLLVASIKGFGAEASDASTIIDLLNGVSNEYATNLEELLVGFARVSPVAKAAGLSFEETAGLLTPGIEVFRSGSEVSNALRTSLLKLQDDSKPVQEALAAIGVSQRDANGELRSARDIYFDVAEAFQSLDGNQRTYYAAQLVGLEQAAKFVAITDGLDKTLRIAGDGFDYAGSAAAEVAIRLQSVEVQVDRAKAAFTDMAVSIGTPLLDEFGSITQAVAGIFSAIGESAADSGGLGELVAYVESVMGDLESTIDQVAQNLPAALARADFSQFREGVDAVAESLGFLFADIDLTTVDGLTKAIEAVGAGFNGLSQFTAGVIESFKPLFSLLVDVATGMTELDSSTIKSAGNFSGFITQANALAGGLEGALPVLEGVLAVFTLNQAGGLIGAFGRAATALSGASGLVALLGQAGLVGAAGGAGYAVGTLLAGGIDKVVAATTKSDSLGAWIADLVYADEIAAAAAVSVDSLLVPVANLSRTASVASVDIESLLVPMDQLYRNADLTGEALVAHNAAMLNNAAAMRSGASAAFEYAGSLQAQEDAAAGLKPIFDDITGAIIGYDTSASKAITTLDGIGKAADGSVKSLSEISEETKKAEEAQRQWNQEVLKMQHAEKLEIIQAQAQITTAEIEASARRTVAAYESLSVTVQSTGQVITDLYGVLASGDLDISQRFDLERLIGAENERRGEALALQNELTEAQIKEANARADSLARGDGIITINGDGLAPHLEAFMWEILRAIQVRVNAEGYEMLLGT